jgi:hypothetical protein
MRRTLPLLACLLRSKHSNNNNNNNKKSLFYEYAPNRDLHVFVQIAIGTRANAKHSRELLVVRVHILSESARASLT